MGTKCWGPLTAEAQRNAEVRRGRHGAGGRSCPVSSAPTGVGLKEPGHLLRELARPLCGGRPAPCAAPAARLLPEELVWTCHGKGRRSEAAQGAERPRGVALASSARAGSGPRRRSSSELSGLLPSVFIRVHPWQGLPSSVSSVSSVVSSPCCALRVLCGLCVSAVSPVALG
jgi:hypothetical protein